MVKTKMYRLQSDLIDDPVYDLQPKENNVYTCPK